MENTLYLTFLNEAGRRQTLTVADPVEGLAAEDVEAAMNLIIEKNIFRGSGGDLVEALEAKVVGRTEEVIFTA
ncbi:MAG: DUF2922 domain-containing protein [Firmicutes bacterium]|nr:DUF2922 domain-containing protein [Bacillota bacterium]